MDESVDAREQHQALIVLSRRILIYVIVSSVLNILVYVPMPYMTILSDLVRA